MQLKFNTRLFWVGLAATLWAYFGIAATLAQHEAGWAGPGPPRVGLQLRLPRGAVHLPGRLVEVAETPGQLRIVLLVRKTQDGVPRDPDGAAVDHLPPGVKVEFITAQRRERGAQSHPRVATLQGQDRPLRLPGGREVVVGERFYLSIVRDGVALIPHDGAGLRLLDKPLRRHGWGRGAGRRAHESAGEGGHGGERGQEGGGRNEAGPPPSPPPGEYRDPQPPR